MNTAQQQYVIREATPDDHGAIYDFSLIASQDETVPEFLRNAGEFINKKVQEGRKGVVLAYYDQELVGLIDADLMDDEIHILSIYVRIDHRRKGLASKLVHSLNDLFPGYSKICATAVTDKGRKFWEANGYVVTQWKLEKKLV